jgi:transcription-repair coupling factor (superfamily II helicase)
LLLAARLRLRGQSLRLAKVLFKNERLFLYPPSQDQDAFFYKQRFYPFLETLDAMEKRYVLRDEKGKKLRAIVQDVATLKDALTVLNNLSATK